MSYDIYIGHYHLMKLLEMPFLACRQYYSGYLHVCSILKIDADKKLIPLFDLSQLSFAIQIRFSNSYEILLVFIS